MRRRIEQRMQSKDLSDEERKKEEDMPHKNEMSLQDKQNTKVEKEQKTMSEQVEEIYHSEEQLIGEAITLLRLERMSLASKSVG